MFKALCHLRQSSGIVKLFSRKKQTVGSSPPFSSAAVFTSPQVKRHLS